MSTSNHPIAATLEGFVGGDEKLLGTVMGLPLLDGIFPALVLAGALTETIGPYPVVGTLPLGVFQVGLLVFGGSATVAVVLAEMQGSRAERVRAVVLVGSLLTVGAALEAAIAPTLESVLQLHIFERFAALVIVAIAAKTASARIGEYLPRPGVIVGAGLIASLDLADPTLAVSTDAGLVAAAAGSAIVGSAFALAVAVLAPYLRARMHVDRFRFGSAVALGLLAVSIVPIPVNVGSAPLLVLGVAALFAFDPDGVDADDAAGEDAPVSDAPDSDATVDDATVTEVGSANPSADDGSSQPVGPAPQTVTDGGDPPETQPSDEDGSTDDESDDEPGSRVNVDREPWL